MYSTNLRYVSHYDFTALNLGRDFKTKLQVYKYKNKSEYFYI